MENVLLFAVMVGLLAIATVLLAEWCARRIGCSRRAWHKQSAKGETGSWYDA